MIALTPYLRHSESLIRTTSHISICDFQVATFAFL